MDAVQLLPEVFCFGYPPDLYGLLLFFLEPKIDQPFDLDDEEDFEEEELLEPQDPQPLELEPREEPPREPPPRRGAIKV